MKCVSVKFENEPMLEIYIFEATQILDLLEQVIISSEKTGKFTEDGVNEIFRFMHTIKGSSAMMLFNNITTMAHSMEDLFYFIREKKPSNLDFSTLSDLVLESVDFIKIEVAKIRNSDAPDGNPEALVEQFKKMLESLKAEYADGTEIKKPESEKKIQYYIPQEKKAKVSDFNRYKGKIFFSDDCEMENIRAYTVIFGLTELAEEVFFLPADILDNDETAQQIRDNGFEVFIKTNMPEVFIREHLEKTIFLKTLEFKEVDEDAFDQFKEPLEHKIAIEISPVKVPFIETQQVADVAQKEAGSVAAQTMISVHVEKLDGLMNLVGELVIAEAMVTQNPVAELVESENFQKSARQLHKITGELQDMVMSIRMVPLSTTFVKMHRIMRDMCKKLNKEITLELYGEETEVDKNIIEHISDPLMHLIRNSIDHGIEDEQDRVKKGKERVGKIILEAKNSGSDVLIIIKDDGKGLNKDRILEKAKENGLLYKPESEMLDREIYNLILLPGFSTKEQVTEFSGRGVGMDVVAKNLEAVGGVVLLDSELDKGTTIILKIPLTLAIIEGMNIKVGQSRYTIPITTIKESFRPEQKDCIMDPDNNEMVMIRGQCFPILRLHEHYKVKEAMTDLTEGILIMVEQDEKIVCLFADELLGQQQVVVKSLPNYIKSIKKIHGIAGCTLLGDGNISLILDISGLTGLRIR